MARKLTESQKENKRQYERNWYKTIGKEKRKLANAKWEAKQVEKFKELKRKLKCERCPENHIACLEFHHIDPNSKDNNVGNVIRNWSTERLMKELNKCIILCANCHRKEHYKDNL